MLASFFAGEGEWEIIINLYMFFFNYKDNMYLLCRFVFFFTIYRVSFL
jgi:hypothetical protein